MRPPPTPVTTETCVMRALAALAAMLAVLVAASLGAGSASWQQALAKGAFALLLLWMARLAWRRPAGRPERARRRVLRLAAVLLDDELFRAWSESTPSTDAREALLDDLRRALAEPPAVMDAAFAADERRAVAALEASLADELAAPAGAASALESLRPAARALQDAALARARAAGPAAGPVG